MEKLLLVNACMRGPEVSRTYRLCRVFLNVYASIHPDFEMEEVDLVRDLLRCYGGTDIARREGLIKSGTASHTMFQLAGQFALADKIVVGAPYWDFSFPAVLKAYVEHISTPGITFRYTQTGSEGLCRAKKLMYITTAGGYIADADFGFAYFKRLCALYGIAQCEAIRAEGLDIDENDVEAIMRVAETETAAAARLF